MVESWSRQHLVGVAIRRVAILMNILRNGSEFQARNQGVITKKYQIFDGYILTLHLRNHDGRKVLAFCRSCASLRWSLLRELPHLRTQRHSDGLAGRADGTQAMFGFLAAYRLLLFNNITAIGTSPSPSLTTTRLLD